jgi:hypothetical protein
MPINGKNPQRAVEYGKTNTIKANIKLIIINGLSKQIAIKHRVNAILYKQIITVHIQL